MVTSSAILAGANGTRVTAMRTQCHVCYKERGSLGDKPKSLSDSYCFVLLIKSLESSTSQRFKLQEDMGKIHGHSRLSIRDADKLDNLCIRCRSIVIVRHTIVSVHYQAIDTW